MSALASQATHEEDPADPTGQTVLPYVVKIDPPDGRLINEVNSLVSIHSFRSRSTRPKDGSSLCRRTRCARAPRRGAECMGVEGLAFRSLGLRVPSRGLLWAAGGSRVAERRDMGRCRRGGALHAEIWGEEPRDAGSEEPCSAQDSDRFCLGEGRLTQSIL